ncbi:Glu/Leu/Phe/Val family dehydrogenase [Sphingomonas sp. 1P08PE]|uniref:Glu/Leu/Phe/Val family dehydrogenase n=1 Tax=Sphingomonas sp. 1P08PE TaxID=554122 RepID=UPI00399FED58
MYAYASAGVMPEHVHVVTDEATGLECVIALHSTALGPAAGGCRLWSYDGREAMVADACRLAQGMSYKNALADLPFGGGKAVIRRPAGDLSRPALFAAFGRAVATLGGSYVTAEDVGTSVEDMRVVAGETRHVAGLPARAGQVGGDPSPFTARGVFLSMQLAVRRRLERDLSECTVAIQGVGHVGASLARMLHDAGARLIVADVDAAAAARVSVALGAEVASVQAIAAARADVFAPCALGGVLHPGTIGRMTAKLVCGAANNQLRDPADAALLADRGILYAPDIVVNAGGIINVAAEYLGWSADEVAARVAATPDRLARVLDRAERDGTTTHAAAEALACARIDRGTGRRAAA